MCSMIVTADAGGALPFMVAIYHEQLKTAVLLFRAMVELVKHHVQEAQARRNAALCDVFRMLFLFSQCLDSKPI